LRARQSCSCWRQRPRSSRKTGPGAWTSDGRCHRARL